jgi:DNA-binding MarR family transcriptional regulator
VDSISALPTLLSQALIAFTIEFDNVFEHRMPHRTTYGPAATSSRGPWLVSQAMWANFVQFVTVESVPLRQLAGHARLINLKGLQRWGFVVVEPGADGPTVRLARGGRKAQEIWRPLAAEIEQRWNERFGVDEVSGLRESLERLVGQRDSRLPQYLPAVGFEMFTKVPDLKGEPMPAGGIADVSVLLSQVLVAFTIDFERESEVSLPISANALRVLDETGTRVRDLPRLTGVSKEAISMSLGRLVARGHVVIGPDPDSSRTKLAHLTPKGRSAQDTYHQLLAAVEQRWQTQYGTPVDSLSEVLGRLVGTPPLSPLWKGLEPYPNGWRASIRRPETLPHHPMVLHRGGYPDGS